MRSHYVLIIEDERIVAENLTSILTAHLPYECFIADNLKDAQAFIQQYDVRLIISDINLNGQVVGPDVVKTLLAIKKVPVIYLTAYSSEQILQAALDTHPVAYVLKPFLERQVLVAVKMALSSAVPTEALLPQPSVRELEVIRYLAEGLSSRKIAERLFISEHTVNTHRKNLLKRYSMESTSELVAVAIKNKWIAI